MLPDTYLISFKKFITEEVDLIGKHSGEENANRATIYYTKMYQYVSTHIDEFIYFDDSGVDFFRCEFAERVEKIRTKLIIDAWKIGIPYEALFIPRIKVAEKTKWQSIISIRLIPIINNIYDNDGDDEFLTMRLFNIEDRNGEIAKWVKSKNGRNFLFEFQITEGIRSEALIKKRLYLFDKKFLWTQMAYMSEKIWVHAVIKEAFNKWKNEPGLWNKISHLKRSLTTKELLDESRKEIKFLRLLENHGFTGRFIHDEIISWQIKYRPDFWFVKENLIVEYDEKAHSLQSEQDKRREKIIKKYLPSIKFIRVIEGNEGEGLQKIIRHIIEMEKLQ